MINQTAIFAPIFAVILLTMAVWAVMYFRRISYVLANKIDHQIVDRGAFEAKAPAHVNNASDNLKNLFEVPTLFYAVTLILFVTDSVTATAITLAWIFAIFRILHSLIHCTYNRVIHRFAVYVIASLSLWALILQGLWTYLS